MIKSVKAKTLQGQLPPMPLDPALIREGKPVARGVFATQSKDKLLSSGVWSCEAGVFDWTYDWDEFVYILEGEVEITESTGEVHHCLVGDTAHFPRGTKVRWRVIKPVRKFFALRTPAPLNV